MNPKVVLTVLDQYVGQVRSASGDKGDEVVGIDLYPQVLDPNYHRAADTVMDFKYASNIACVIAHAVKELAQ